MFLIQIWIRNTDISNSQEIHISLFLIQISLFLDISISNTGISFRNTNICIRNTYLYLNTDRAISILISVYLGIFAALVCYSHCVRVRLSMLRFPRYQKKACVLEKGNWNWWIPYLYNTLISELHKSRCCGISCKGMCLSGTNFKWN